MEDQSFYKALQTGVSDGTHSGNRGLQENYARQARVVHEADKLGKNLVLGVVALFLHPRLCFVGFWLIAFGLLLALAPAIGIESLPHWYGWTAATVALALTIMLRRVVRKLMLGTFVTACLAALTYMAIDLMDFGQERASTAAVSSSVAAPSTPRPPRPSAADVQRALREASRPEVTSTPPEDGNLFTDYYCGASVPAAERPDWCP